VTIVVLLILYADYGIDANASDAHHAYAPTMGGLDPAKNSVLRYVARKLLESKLCENSEKSTMFLDFNSVLRWDFIGVFRVWSISYLFCQLHV